MILEPWMASISLVIAAGYCAYIVYKISTDELNREW